MPSVCTAAVTWSSELDFRKTVAYIPGFLCECPPRNVDVYVARRKGSLIFDPHGFFFFAVNRLS